MTQTVPPSFVRSPLSERVYPPGHRNPVPSGRYNLVVVGAGTAVLVCAAGAAGLGATVALVERRALGGDCLNVGCVPSKTLIRAAHAAHAITDAARFGVHATVARIDFAAVMARVREVRYDSSGHDSVARFESLAGIIHPYPTRAAAIRKAGDLYNRTRLTPTARTIFGRWLAWRR